MTEPASEEVKLLRAIVKGNETRFVTYSASEEDSFLYKKNTGNITTVSATVNSGSLQIFDVGNGKVKLLFKVEDS